MAHHFADDIFELIFMIQIFCVFALDLIDFFSRMIQLTSHSWFK